MISNPADVEQLRLARERVLERIASAAQRVGRDPAEVTIVAVSKTVPAARLRAALAAGLRIFGENRVQEAEAKVPELPGATWHLVGPLQSNKVRRALDLFETIETVHSAELAGRLDGLLAAGPGGAKRAVLLQVNVDRDEAKSGFLPDDLARAVES
ncbi:MAG: alanine racemase, partial [Chloroflexota bacterium]|nr:alanine racemase [Chloroflexota bacterium]